MRTGYKCRAYPTPEQEQILNRTFGCVRKVWNTVLAWRCQRWSQDHKSTNVSEANSFLTRFKREPDHAFKTRAGRQSAEYTRSGFRWREGRLWLAKMDTPLELVWSWPGIDAATLDPSTVVVSRDPGGRWYVSLFADVTEPAPLPATSSAVGVDLGVTDFAVCSNGQRIANPRMLARRARNLARYQRRMVRKQPGSANRAKAKAKVARAHRKVRAARADFLHRTSTSLVRRHDHIVIEDLNVAGMLRNRRLAKAISDAGWGEFRRQLRYKCAKYGRTLTVIDRWYPSSKTCSACGQVLAELTLSSRAWTCPGCGTLHDRDVNAAKNILAAGLAVTACGDNVSHPGPPAMQSSTKQETQPAMAAIPSL
ncbi:MAG TPA: RNA-guided endonuclease TnpB family protein [Candidatus Limnocylindrales bacterium]